MSHEILKHELESEKACTCHKVMKVVKLALKAANVAAAFCMVHELHKIHHNLKKMRKEK